MSIKETKDQIDRLMKRADISVRIHSKRERGVSPPPDIIKNIPGSSAGAGSGEFHVYKKLRRKEMMRIQLIEDDIQKEKEMEEFKKREEEKRKLEEQKTAKKREKRKKRKHNKQKSKSDMHGGRELNETFESESEERL